MFTIYPYITRDRDVTEAVMFGTILISDGHSVRWDGWGLTNAPDHGFVGLFDSDGPYSVDIISGLPMYLGNPTSRYLVPLSSNMATCVELYARTEWNDDLFELGKGCFDTDLKGFLENEEADTRRCLWTCSGQDGYVQMFYILLKDAVDCAIKVTYDGSTEDSGEVFAEIFAYYGGDFFKKGDPFEKKFYTACLFRNRLDPNIPEIPLERSMLAVPANGSIVIEATLFDVDSWDMIMSGDCTFLAQSTDNVRTIGGSCGSFRVSVDWSRG